MRHKQTERDELNGCIEQCEVKCAENIFTGYNCNNCHSFDQTHFDQSQSLLSANQSISRAWHRERRVMRRRRMRALLYLRSLGRRGTGKVNHHRGWESFHSQECSIMASKRWGRGVEVNTVQKWRNVKNALAVVVLLLLLLYREHSLILYMFK